MRLFLILLITLPLYATPQLRVPFSAPSSEFDPTEAEDFINVRILLNLGQGLMSFDKNLKPILGLAKSFKVSENGLTYTFKLKKSHWSDGSPITTQDFLRGFQRTLSHTTQAKLSQNFQSIITGALEYKKNKTQNFGEVGIKVIDDSTIEFKLSHPAPYLLSLLALPFAFPQREENKGIIKANSLTSGPYFISDTSSNSQTKLIPNPHFKPKALSEVVLKNIQDNSTALSLYEKNEIDLIEKIPSADFKRFKNSKELQTQPFLATYYYGFNINKPPFNDVNVRKTLFSSIDKSEIDILIKDKQIISSSWVPYPFETSEEIFNIEMSDSERKEALQKLKIYSSKNPIILNSDTQEKTQLIGNLIQNQIKKKLDLHIELKNYEWKTYLTLLQKDEPSFFRFAWLAAFPDAMSHLSVFTSENPNNKTGFKNKKYDKLVEEISLLKPYSKKRIDKIRQAQKILISENAVILPIFHYRQYVLIKKEWSGIQITPIGIIRFDQANLKHEL